MTHILIPQMQRKGMNQGAFGTPLDCPALVAGPDNVPRICGARKWKYVERISPFRIRYRCKVCGKTMQYDYSNRLDHPYAVFGKNKWRQIVDRYKQGTRPLI